MLSKLPAPWSPSAVPSGLPSVTVPSVIVPSGSPPSKSNEIDPKSLPGRSCPACAPPLETEGCCPFPCPDSPEAEDGCAGAAWSLCSVWGVAVTVSGSDSDERVAPVAGPMTGIPFTEFSP